VCDLQARVVVRQNPVSIPPIRILYLVWQVVVRLLRHIREYYMPFSTKPYCQDVVVCVWCVCVCGVCVYVCMCVCVVLLCPWVQMPDGDDPSKGRCRNSFIFNLFEILLRLIPRGLDISLSIDPTFVLTLQYVWCCVILPPYCSLC
jgi:hypothetical protein